MASYSGLEKYAFVSYSHKDSEVVKKVIDRLSSKGARIWYDEDLVPSDEYIEVIADKIEKSSAFIAFISANSTSSRYCRDEIRYAYEREKKMMVIYLDDVELSAGYKMMLNGVQSVRLRELKREVMDEIFSALPRDVVNDGGRILMTTDEYTFLFNPKDSGCGYSISRVSRNTGKAEEIYKTSFPPQSEFVIDYIGSKRHYGLNFTLTVTVTWDFTYAWSGHDDDYYDETYEYTFYNLNGEKCGFETAVIEHHDHNTGTTTHYNYVKGVDTHVAGNGRVSSISGLDCFGNYWNVTGKNEDGE